jgi:ABC-type nitrate/sulfonate/bicarbonate transport system substrate-binding protein
MVNRRAVIAASVAAALNPVLVRAQARTPLVVDTSAPLDVLPYFYAVQHGLFETAGLDITT